MKRIVVIGGGTGSFVMLSGLKKHPVQLSAIVTMSDSGGSSGRLRDEYGVLPPGDVRQCLVALSESDDMMRRLFNYRFGEGSLKGQSFGNLFITALVKLTGSFEKAITAAERILAIKGSVIPVTTDSVNLCAELEDGQVIRGETHIDEPAHDGRLRIKRAWLHPPARASRAALDAIRKADLIVIGPGDLYTSIIANVMASGIPQALNASRAKKAYVCNLMTKFGQTNGFTVREHIRELERYIGRGVLDYVLVNVEAPPAAVLKMYAEEQDFPVRDDLGAQYSSGGKKVKLIKEKLLNKTLYKKSPGDLLKRSLVRHDPDKLARMLLRL